MCRMRSPIIDASYQRDDGSCDRYGADMTLVAVRCVRCGILELCIYLNKISVVLLQVTLKSGTKSSGEDRVHM